MWNKIRNLIENNGYESNELVNCGYKHMKFR